MQPDLKTTSKRNEKPLTGFALLKIKDPIRFKKIVIYAGKMSQRSKIAHRWKPEECAEMGRRGGLKAAENRRLKAE